MLMKSLPSLLLKTSFRSNCLFFKLVHKYVKTRLLHNHRFIAYEGSGWGGRELVTDTW